MSKAKRHSRSHCPWTEGKSWEPKAKGVTASFPFSGSCLKGAKAWLHDTCHQQGSCALRLSTSLGRWKEGYVPWVGFEVVPGAGPETLSGRCWHKAHRAGSPHVWEHAGELIQRRHQGHSRLDHSLYFTSSVHGRASHIVVPGWTLQGNLSKMQIPGCLGGSVG